MYSWRPFTNFVKNKTNFSIYLRDHWKKNQFLYNPFVGTLHCSESKIGKYQYQTVV